MAVGSESGILAAHNLGTIKNCSTSGIIRAGSSANLWQLGGIVGVNGGLIDQCWSDATVTATTTSQWYYGGLVGENLVEATISNSFFCGMVTGARSSGLAGMFQGTMTNCYTVGRVYTMNDTWARPTVGQLGTTYSIKDKGNVAQQKLLSRDGSTAYTGWDTDSYTLNCTTAANMLLATTYTSLNWDTNIWHIVDGELPTLINTPRANPPVANPWP